METISQLDLIRIIQDAHNAMTINIWKMISSVSILTMYREEYMKQKERIEHIALKDALIKLANDIEALQKNEIFSRTIKK